jgi:hypothetical protein
VPAPSNRSSDLRLACPGCGAVLGLDRAAPLVRRLRPFIEEHADCAGTSYDVDREMRTAFKIPA